MLLALYAGTVRAITLAEPAQTLHYGFEPETDIPQRGSRVVDVSALAAKHGSAAKLATELLRPGERVRFPSGDTA